MTCCRVDHFYQDKRRQDIKIAHKNTICIPDPDHGMDQTSSNKVQEQHTKFDQNPTETQVNK